MHIAHFACASPHTPLLSPHCKPHLANQKEKSVAGKNATRGMGNCRIEMGSTVWLFFFYFFIFSFFAWGRGPRSKRAGLVAAHAALKNERSWAPLRTSHSGV